MNRYIEGGLVAAVMVGSVVALSAEGASFDCGKARTKVEKIICSDAELSKLDEEMAALYGEVLKASSNSPVLKQAQRDWLKYRQTCLTAAYKQKESICLSYIYRRHISILHGSLPTEPDTNKNVSQLCTDIAILVERGEALKLEPNDWENNPPRGTNYKNIDIDGDEVADSVTTGCGSGECLLEVELSSGGKFDLGDSPFYLIRYQRRIFALVSSSEDDESKDPKISTKYHLGRLYLIAPTGAKMVCGK